MWLDLYTPDMAGPPSAAFSQLIVRWTGAALPFPAITTHGFTTPVGEVGDVLSTIEGAVGALRSYASTFVTAESVTWKVGPVATGQSVTLPINLPGLTVGGVAPANVAALVSLAATDISGRFHGRFFLPGIVEFGIDDSSNLTNDHRATIQDAVDDFYTIMAEVEAEPRVFSTISSDPRTVENITVQRRVSTQRRRMRR